MLTFCAVENLRIIYSCFSVYVKKGPPTQGYGFSSGHVWMWELEYEELSAKELMLLNCGVGEDSWESLGLQGDPTSPS